jgi:pseudouridine kinase
MDQGQRRVVCAGGAVVDLKLRLDAPSVGGTSNPGSASSSFGGVARNVAEGLAGLLAGAGPTVELVSAVGDDPAGAALLADLRRCGVSSEHVQVVPGEATAQYVAVLEPGGDLTIGAAAMGVLDRVDVAALDAAWPEGGRLFCDGNLSAKVLEHILIRARAGTTSVCFDAVSTHKVVRLPADLRGLGLLCCNTDEALAWLAHHSAGREGGPDPLGPDRVASELIEDDVVLAARLQSAGAAAVLLTRGENGLVLVEGGVDGVRVDEIPAVPAVPVDVTGAGDALIAATLAALIQGASLSEAARAGAERAARTVESQYSVLPS